MIINFFKRLFCKPKRKMSKISTAGKPFSAAEIKAFVDNLRGKGAKLPDKKKGAVDELFMDGGDYRRAEVFGADNINKLLGLQRNRKGEAVSVHGIRIYYGVAYEIEKNGEISMHKDGSAGGSPKMRMFLVPVDENGKDIDFDETTMKDPDGSGYGGGLPCPQHCTP